MRVEGKKRDLQHLFGLIKMYRVSTFSFSVYFSIFILSRIKKNGEQNVTHHWTNYRRFYCTERYFVRFFSPAQREREMDRFKLIYFHLALVGAKALQNECLDEFCHCVLLFDFTYIHIIEHTNTFSFIVPAPAVPFYSPDFKSIILCSVGCDTRVQITGSLPLLLFFLFFSCSATYFSLVDIEGDFPLLIASWKCNYEQIHKTLTAIIIAYCMKF